MRRGDRGEAVRDGSGTGGNRSDAGAGGGAGRRPARGRGDDPAASGVRRIAGATDTAGRYSDTRLPLRVTTGVVVDGPGTLDLATLREGDTLIVRSGELLATGDATLRRLVVLGGARLAATPGEHPRVSAAHVSVGCGGELDLVSPAPAMPPASTAPGVIE